MLEMILKVSCSLVLKVVSRSEKGPLSDSGVRFARRVGLLLLCPHLLIAQFENSTVQLFDILFVITNEIHEKKIFCFTFH